MIIKKVKGEQSTNLSLRTKSEVNESYFELDISYGEMLVLQRMLDVIFNSLSNFKSTNIDTDSSTLYLSCWDGTLWKVEK